MKKIALKPMLLALAVLALPALGSAHEYGYRVRVLRPVYRPVVRSVYRPVYRPVYAPVLVDPVLAYAPVYVGPPAPGFYVTAAFHGGHGYHHHGYRYSRHRHWR